MNDDNGNVRDVNSRAENAIIPVLESGGCQPSLLQSCSGHGVPEWDGHPLVPEGTQPGFFCNLRCPGCCVLPSKT